MGWDAVTYLAAGERLNAGHPLYELGPGDRWVWINPPYWSVPLLYPPTIAVFWRPLAALPSDAGIGIWVLANGAALVASIVVIIARGGWRPALTAVVLSPAIAFELKVGNLHGVILAALVLVYLRPRAGAILVGLLAAVKLTPAVILVWLFASGRPRDAVLGAAVGAVALATSVLLVGSDQFGAYLAAVAISSPSIISIPGLLQALGVPAAKPIAWALTAFLLLEVVWLRGRPLSWVVAILAMVIGSPVVNIPTLLLLIAVWLPYGTDPMRRAEPIDPVRSAAGAPG